MRKKNIIIILMAILLVLSLSACDSRNRTITDREEARKIVEEFYGDMLNEDPITMESYYEENLSTSLTKDRDMLEVYNEYDQSTFYSFVTEGKRYTITTDGSVFEDESTYEFYADSIDLMLRMNVLAYFDIEDESVSYSLIDNRPDYLELTIKYKQEDQDTTIVTKGIKENGKVTDITSSISTKETAYSLEYRFNYDKHIELPEYSLPKSYDNMKHVESPYKTYGEIIDRLAEDEYLSYMFMEDELIVIGEKEGRHYQFSSKVSQELTDAYEALDFFDENYESNFHNLIRNIEIEDCIDFTDEIISEQQFAEYEGKTVEDLINDGFEVNGYSFFEDENILFVSKDGMSYRLDVKITEGFDIEGDYEYDAFNGFTVLGGSFENVEYNILPMR